MKKLAAALAFTLAGCGSDGGSSGGTPAALALMSPIVLNVPDAFAVLPAGSIQNGRYQYEWPCGADQANLAVSAVEGGWVRIEIQDENGVRVHDNFYTGGLEGTISGFTSPGARPGLWRIWLTFTDVTSVGSIDIQADLINEPDVVVLTGAYSHQSSYQFDARWAAGSAKVVLGCSIWLGSVRVRLWDGKGTLVMDCSNECTWVGGTDGTSDPGAEGIWTVRIDVDAIATAGDVTISHP